MALATTPQQINLYNPSLMPARERFSARHIVVWIVFTALSLGVFAWWAKNETQSLRREMADQAARAPAPRAGEGGTTPQQVAALEQALRDRLAMLESRKAARDALKRGIADRDNGPSGVMRLVAQTIPPTAWISEVRVAGSRFEVAGKALDPGAIDGWLERLRESGRVAAAPPPAVRVERIETPVGATAHVAQTYVFHISATLATPFADDGAKP
jgi:hypothetical protein